MKLTITIILAALAMSCCPCKDLRGTFAKTHIGMRYMLKMHRKHQVRQLKSECLPDSVFCERLRIAELRYMEKISINEVREREGDGVYLILRGHKYR